jgi:hypothetical protein
VKALALSRILTVKALALSRILTALALIMILTEVILGQSQMAALSFPIQ